jgi:hypothetical protein
VYATEWTADAISVYHFSRANIPSDLNAGNPDPSSWGEPLAVFNGCDFREAVNNQTIIFDTTFCGQYAGQDAVWKADAVCSQKAATCQDYVANNPGDFANAFWEVNYLKVYQQQDDGYIGQSPLPAPQTSLPAASSGLDPVQTTTSDPTVTSMFASNAPVPPMQSVPPSGQLSQSLSTLSTVLMSSRSTPGRAPHFRSTAFLTVDMTTTITMDDTGLQLETATPPLPNGPASNPAQNSEGGCTRDVSGGCISKRAAQKPGGDCTESVSGGCISEQRRQQSRQAHTPRRHLIAGRQGGNMII